MKPFFQNIKLVILGIVVAIGASYAYAVTVVPPTLTPPTGNMPLPVHQLSGAQVKTGGLSVAGFTAFQNSTLKQDAFFRGVLKGAPSGGNLSRVTMGSTQSPVTATVNGKITNNLSVGADDIVSSSNQTVCGDAQGHIILCPVTSPSGPICGNTVIELPGEQCDDGNTTSGDGCSNTCQNETGGTVIMVEGVGASSAPVQGGTGNENVICSAILTSPAAQDMEFFIEYKYKSDSDPNVYSRNCTVSLPAGSTWAENYPGDQLSYGGDVTVDSYCFAGSNPSIPRSPSMSAPNC